MGIFSAVNVLGPMLPKSAPSIFVTFLVVPLLPTLCRCTGLLFHLITMNETNNNRQDSPGRVIGPSQSTTQNINRRQTSMPPAGFEPVIPVSERSQAYALDRAAARIGCPHSFVTKRDFKLLTLRRLMSYIYGAPILDVSRSHTTTQHSR